MDRCLQLDPQHWQGLAHKAKLELEASRLDEARSLIDRAVSVEPSCAWITQLRLILLQHAADWDGMLRLCADWLKPDGTFRMDWRRRRARYINAETVRGLRVLRGTAFLGKRQMQEAYCDLKSVVGTADSAASEFESNTFLRICLVMNKYAEAAEHLQCVSARENKYMVSNCRGVLSYAQGRYEQALEAYRDALDVAETPEQRERALEELGWTLWNLERFSESWLCAEKVSGDRGLLLRAQLKFSEKDFAASQALLEQIRNELSEDITTHQLLGAVLEAQGETAKARAAYQRCLELGWRASWEPERARVESARASLAELG